MAKSGEETDAERLKVRALARWEGEGGALSPEKSGEILDELDLRILKRLGAAVLGEWSNLPTDVQRAIFQRASTPSALGDGARLRSEIANFLHTHKGR